MHRDMEGGRRAGGGSGGGGGSLQLKGGRRLRAIADSLPCSPVPIDARMCNLPLSLGPKDVPLARARPVYPTHCLPHVSRYSCKRGSSVWLLLA